LRNGKKILDDSIVFSLKQRNKQNDSHKDRLVLRQEAAMSKPGLRTSDRMCNDTDRLYNPGNQHRVLLHKEVVRRLHPENPRSSKNGPKRFVIAVERQATSHEITMDVMLKSDSSRWMTRPFWNGQRNSKELKDSPRTTLLILRIFD
jgi:hypothetical protein